MKGSHYYIHSMPRLGPYLANYFDVCAFNLRLTSNLDMYTFIADLIVTLALELFYYIRKG